MAVKWAGTSGDGSRENPLTIDVSSEADAFELLRLALKDEFRNLNVVLDFKHWPLLQVAYEGVGYDSTVTPKMAESLVELQHAINRAYTRLVRGQASANVLTNEERRAIEFKAKVEKGSSLVTVDMESFASKLAADMVGKMTGTELVIAIIGVALAGGSLLAYKAFLASRSEDRKVEQSTKERIALSQEETQRMRIMNEAFQSRPFLKVMQEDFDGVRHDFVRSIGDAETIKMQGFSLSADEARRFAATPRSKSDDVQLNGQYLISRIDWSKDPEAKLMLFSQDEAQLEFNAWLNTENLSVEQKETLKTCEWERQKVYFSINATKLRGQVTTARIVGVGWPNSDAG